MLSAWAAAAISAALAQLAGVVTTHAAPSGKKKKRQLIYAHLPRAVGPTEDGGVLAGQALATGAIPHEGPPVPKQKKR